MSNMFELNCWILGEDPERIFAVQIAKSMTIYDLKSLIKDKKMAFDGIDAACLMLWKVNITDLDSLDTINEGNIPGEMLDPWSYLLNVFTDRPELERLHIIVQHPDESDHRPAKRARIHEFPEPDADLLNLHKHFWQGKKDLFVKHSVQIPDPLSLEVGDDSERLTLTVIEHPGGMFCFGGTKLIVPEIFETFQKLLELEDERWEEMVGSHRWDYRFESTHHSTIVTGQTGIGKTAFLIYMLICRLMHGKTTIYCDTNWHAHIFDNKGVRKMTLSDGYTLPELNADSSCCALVDISGKLTLVPQTFYPSVRKGRVVVATRPNKQHWSNFAHQHLAMIYCMPTWSWGLVYFGSLPIACKDYSEQPGIDHCKRLQHVYSIFRGIPRFCYRALSEIGLELELGLIDDALNCVLSMAAFIHAAAAGDMSFGSSTSHHLVRVEPVDDRWQTIHTELLSDYVAERVFDRIRLVTTAQLSQTIMHHLSDPRARSKAGILFKHAAHFSIRQGRTLMMTRLLSKSQSGKGMEATVDIVVPLVGDNEKSRYYSLAIQEKSGSQKVHPDFLHLYMTPITKNEPSIDALFITEYTTLLFQMTVSNNHPIEFLGLDRVISQLPAEAQQDICIVFVTPAQNEYGGKFQGNQSTQPIVAPQGVDIGKLKQFQAFHQYVCQLDINDTVAK